MIEIGLGVLFVGLMICMIRYIYPAVKLANELKADYKFKGYRFPEEWE